MSYTGDPGLHWKFDETSGSVAADSSGNSRPGGYGGSTGPTLGEPSLRGDGVGYSITIPDTAAWVDRESESWMNNASGTTVTGVFKAAALPPVLGALWARDSAAGGGARQWVLYTTSAGHFQFIGSTQSVSDLVVTSPSVMVPTGGVRFYVGMSWDASVGEVSIYSIRLDTMAKVKWTFNFAGAPRTTVADHPFRVGNIGSYANLNSNLGWHWRGQIDDVKYLPGPLSETRIDEDAAEAASAGGSTATLNATAPAPVVSLAATVAQPATTAALNATAPLPVVSLAADVAIPIDAALNATAPTPVVSLSATLSGAGVDLDATLNAVAPTPVVSLAATVEVGYPTGFTLIRRPMPFGRTVAPALLPAPVPPRVTERAITVLAHPMPAFTPSNKRNRPGVDYQLLHGDPVRAHIFVDGVDVTFLRDHPAVIGDWSSSDPLTDTAAAFTMPQIAEGDALGSGDLSMFDLDRDPTVDIALIRESDGALLHVWDGHIAREDDSSGEGTGRSFICEGSIMAAAHSPHMPPTIMDETDIGIVIPRVLNGTPNRRFHTIAETVTGITTSKRGNQAMSRLQYVEELLATAYTETGHQVTLTKIGPRQHALVVKDDTAWTARVVKGAHGINARLARDQSMRWDAIYGEGVAPNGGGWGNWFFPGLDLFVPPPYPYTPGSGATISVGDTDAGTVTGDGVTVATTRLADLGYAVTPGSTFTSAHAAATSQLQRANGLLVDGIVGPQTWTSMFTPGLDEIDLQAVRLPLASKPWVLPNEYAANGATIGPNPNHDPVPVPKAPNIKFGADITKAHATELARRMLITNGEPAWTGTLTLTSDPIDPDGVPFSRLMLREGDMVLVEGHDGDTVMRVADASRDGVTVTLRVDEKNRDALTLDAIRLRNMEARQDTVPPGSPQKISSLTRDHIVQFEEESKAGQIPTYPVNGNVGLWSVFPIVVSQTGRIAKLDAMARNATTTFVMAFFGREIQPQRLAALVPDPIASSDGWREHEETLILEHAWIETFGGPGSLAGYSPWQQSDGRPVTGDLRDYSGVEFTSERRGYLWVAVFSSASCNISGRAYPAIPQ